MGTTVFTFFRLVTSCVYHKKMKTSPVSMGIKWGNMQRDIRGIVQYSLSPHEQKAFAGAFSNGLPNLIRRFRSQVFRVAPPFILGYMIYDWNTKEYAAWPARTPPTLSLRSELCFHASFMNFHMSD